MRMQCQHGGMLGPPKLFRSSTMQGTLPLLASNIKQPSLPDLQRMLPVNMMLAPKLII